MNVEKFAALMIRLRKEKGLTQKQAALQFGVSDKSVSKWERGETMPDVSLFPEIADFYGISIDSLLKGERTDSPAKERDDLQNRKKTEEHRSAKKFFLLFAVADLFLLVSFLSWLIVGFYTENGWKDVIFSCATFLFTAGIAIGYLRLSVKNALPGRRSKKYSYLLFFHCLAGAVFFIACSKLFVPLSEVIAAGTVVGAVCAAFLCFINRESKIVKRLIEFRADILLSSFAVAAVCYFLPFATIRSENPDFEIKVSIWRALESVGIQFSVPVFLLFLFAAAYTVTAVYKKLPSWSIFLSWLPLTVLTAAACNRAGTILTELYGKYFSAGIRETVACPFLLYGLVAAILASAILFLLSKRGALPKQEHVGAL